MEDVDFWRSSSYRYENLEKEINLPSNLPCINQPQTPMEPMEFLSRSWSISAAEISKAFAQKHKQFVVEKINLNALPESFFPLQHQPKVMNIPNVKKLRPTTKWFNHRDSVMRTVKKKDKARAENAKTHAALCVAGLAAALAAVTAAENSSSGGSKMSSSVASATELLASHCFELAESAGADRDRVASVVRSAVDIKSPSDLLTLTAAAATALRGEAAMKARFAKEAKKNATVIPYEKGIGEAHMLTAFHSETTECQHQYKEEDLLQQVHKGGLQWKQVSIYINKKSQVIIKLKSKHVGGAFSTKNKGVVYGVCDEKASWPFRKQRENVETYFGVKTAKGLLEFKCKSKIHKQKWVDAIQCLLQRTTNVEGINHSLSMSNI